MQAQHSRLIILDDDVMKFISLRRCGRYRSNLASEHKVEEGSNDRKFHIFGMQVDGDSLGTTVLRVFDDTFHTVLSPPGVTEVWFQVLLQYGLLYVVVHPQDASQRDQTIGGQIGFVVVS